MVGLAAAALASCVRPVAPPPATVADSKARTNAAVLGVAASDLGGGYDAAAAARALSAFRISCPSLIRRDDTSGLTRTSDWSDLCADAARWPDAAATRFFATRFERVQVGDGAAFATGYFEPEIAGSRTAIAGGAPIYRRPADLVEVALGTFSEALKGKTVRGRAEDGKLVLYHDRAAIEGGALAGRGLEIAWADDPIELFFLQIQGSGRVRFADGRILRIGYDGQNGRDYTAIGRVLRERDALKPGEAGMDGIIAWMRRQPDKGAALMRENKSYVFFRELTGPGPLGALGLPVTARASVAADPAFVPLGAPILIEADGASGLWIAQDTGGAIKGANRFDTFWGAGDEARRIAGAMSVKGRAALLLPVGTIARLTGAERGETPARR